MVRYVNLPLWPLVVPVLVLGIAGAAWAQPGPTVRPTMFELVINGESFLVQANRGARLQSKRQPGVSYDVALRIAPVQRLNLNSFRFDYDWLARVQDDGKRLRRTVRVSHELGFTMLITDLAAPLDEKARDEALKILTESAAATFKKLKSKDIVAGPPRDRRFAGSSGRGAVIRYRDHEDLPHTCLVYVLGGPKFALTCVVQYLDDDFDEVKRLVKMTLDSFRPLR